MADLTLAAVLTKVKSPWAGVAVVCLGLGVSMERTTHAIADNRAAIVRVDTAGTAYSKSLADQLRDLSAQVTRANEKLDTLAVRQSQVLCYLTPRSPLCLK